MVYRGQKVKNNINIIICLVLGIGLLTSVNATQRVVVSEMAYSEG